MLTTGHEISEGNCGVFNIQKTNPLISTIAPIKWLNQKQSRYSVMVNIR